LQIYKCNTNWNSTNDLYEILYHYTRISIPSVVTWPSFAVRWHSDPKSCDQIPVSNWTHPLWIYIQLTHMLCTCIHTHTQHMHSHNTHVLEAQSVGLCHGMFLAFRLRCTTNWDENVFASWTVSGTITEFLLSKFSLEMSILLMCWVYVCK